MAKMLEVDVAHPESVLPGTLEQLDHLEGIALLQNHADSPRLSLLSSRAVAFQLLSRNLG